MVLQSVRALEVCFCALAVLSVSPRPVSAEHPEPIRTGLWVTQRVADELNGFEEKVWANPYLTGVRLTANWNEIEKESGKIDFSGIDRAVASIAAHREELRGRGRARREKADRDEQMPEPQ